MAPTVRLLTIVRDPVAHVISQYAHCQQAGSLGMAKHNYPNITLQGWLALHWRGALQLNHAATSAGLEYCGYNPFNKQTSVLTGGGLSVDSALEALRRAYWVGITDSFEASVCLLLSELNDRPMSPCRSAGPQAAPVTSMVETHGTHTRDIALTGSMRSQILDLTRKDMRLFEYARSRLHNGLQRFNLSYTFPTSRVVRLST